MYHTANVINQSLKTTFSPAHNALSDYIHVYQVTGYIIYRYAAQYAIYKWSLSSSTVYTEIASTGTHYVHDAILHYKFILIVYAITFVYSTELRNWTESLVVTEAQYKDHVAY